MKIAYTTLSRAADVLAYVPAALITDIDGTISPIVPRPDSATVSESVRASLRRLAAKLALTAVITAREASVARRMVGVRGITYVGNYALDGAFGRKIGSKALARARQDIRPLLAPFPCVTLEDKGVSFSLHYRNCEDGTMRERLLALAASIAAAADARILEGKQVIELVPGGLPDKGVAIARLLQSKAIRGVVYLGDDVSDVAVFREVARRRDESGLPGLSVAVIDAETDETVREAADMTVAGVEEAEELLASLALALEKGEA
jgi:trehalose 6-phosphate phosphatase